MMLYTSVLLFALQFGQATDPPIVVGPNTKLEIAWDQVTTDINGQPETVAGYDVNFGPAGIDPNVDDSGILDVRPVGPDEYVGVDVSNMFIGKSSGQYAIWVKTIDAAGNKSVYSAPLTIVYDNTPPTAPPKIRYKITIQLEITNP